MAKMFNHALELATDQTNVDPDWSGIMECIDLIRGKEISTKDAANLIVKRLKNSNPHVVHHTLLLLEACMKNCGSQFHREVLSTRFLEELKEIITHSPPSSEVTKKLLEMIQIWYSAFGNKSQFTAVKDIHTILQVSGYQFPAAKESDYMFAAQCAPDWVDGDQCFRCRADFTLFKRKHHCRACGQIFCDSCSSHQMYLPQFGIEKNVRVCEACFEKTPAKTEPSQPQKKKSDDEEARRQKELDEKFQEDLQLALALSQSVSDQGHPYTTIREEVKKQPDSEHISYYSANDGLEDSVYRGAAAPSISNESGDDRLSDVGVDSVLARYLDRDYWQKKLESNMGSANENAVPEPGNSEPFPRSTTPTVESVTSGLSSMTTNNFEDNDDIAETKEFCSNISDLVDTLENRMRSNALRGRSIVNDNAVHSLFVQLTERHANIMQRMNALEESRAYLEQMQDTVVHIQDARSAVDALRQEHNRMRQEQLLAAQRLRQQQMQHTLQYMRWQKTMTLENRRAEALKRFHEQERSMFMDRYGNASPYMPPNQPPASMPPPEMYQQPQFFQQPQMPSNSNYPVNFNGSTPFEPANSIPPSEPMSQHQFYHPQQPQMPPNGSYPVNFNGSVPSFEPPTSIPSSEPMGQQPQFFHPPPQQPQMYQPPVQSFSGPSGAPEFQQAPPPQMLQSHQGIPPNFQQQFYSWK